MEQKYTDEYFMNIALKEAHNAFDENEIPIGAVVVLNDKIIGKGHNQTERLQDVTAHAEMIALTSAFNHLGAKYLPEAKLYVTVEPCMMCSGAIYWSKIGQIIYGTPDEKNGFFTKFQFQQLHPKTTLKGGVLQNECATLMKQFFKPKR